MVLDFSSDDKNKELVSSILDILKEKNLIDGLIMYSEEPLASLISFLYESHYMNKDEATVYQTVKRDIFVRTKRRWVRTAIKHLESNTGPNKELRAKKLFFEGYIKQFGLEQFRKEFSIESLDLYLKRKSQELLEWAENDTMPVHSYLFIHEKTKKQKRTAVEIDLLMIIGDFLVNKKKSFKLALHQSPFSAVNTSFFGISNRGKLDIHSKSVVIEEHEIVMGNDQQATYYETVPKNKFAQKQNVKMLVNSDFVTDLNKKVPDLDAKDFELFLDVLSFRDVNFQATRRINFALKDLVRRLYGSDNSKNYKATIERLLKLSNYRITEMNDEGEYYVRSLFSSVKIQNDSKDMRAGKLVTAYVSEDVYDDYLRQQMVNIYSDKVKELKGYFAYHLAFVLQKERIMAHQANEPNPVKRKWLDFSYAIRFNRRTKKENLEELEKALTQIKELNFIIQDFYRSGDYLFFQFYPMASFELDDSTIDSKKL